MLHLELLPVFCKPHGPIGIPCTAIHYVEVPKYTYVLFGRGVPR